MVYRFHGFRDGVMAGGTIFLAVVGVLRGPRSWYCIQSSIPDCNFTSELRFRVLAPRTQHFYFVRVVVSAFLKDFTFASSISSQFFNLMPGKTG